AIDRHADFLPGLKAGRALGGLYNRTLFCFRDRTKVGPGTASRQQDAKRKEEEKGSKPGHKNPSAHVGRLQSERIRVRLPTTCLLPIGVRLTSKIGRTQRSLRLQVPSSGPVKRVP